MREMGYHERIFDLLDERPLTKSELRDFCGVLLGESHVDGIPDPSLDWEGFLRRLDDWLKQKDEAAEQWVRNKLDACVLLFMVVDSSSIGFRLGHTRCFMS